jgi:hypothetical protein
MPLVLLMAQTLTNAGCGRRLAVAIHATDGRFAQCSLESHAWRFPTRSALLQPSVFPSVIPCEIGHFLRSLHIADPIKQGVSLIRVVLTRLKSQVRIPRRPLDLWRVYTLSLHAICTLRSDDCFTASACDGGNTSLQPAHYITLSRRSPRDAFAAPPAG